MAKVDKCVNEAKKKEGQYESKDENVGEIDPTEGILHNPTRSSSHRVVS